MDTKQDVFDWSVMCTVSAQADERFVDGKSLKNCHCIFSILKQIFTILFLTGIYIYISILI